MMKRIPRIKFPQRHSQSSSSPGSVPAPETGSVPTRTDNRRRNLTASSDVPAAPKNTAAGGTASLQPKRTPVSDKEIEAIMLGGADP